MHDRLVELLDALPFPSDITAQEPGKEREAEIVKAVRRALSHGKKPAGRSNKELCNRFPGYVAYTRGEYVQNEAERLFQSITRRRLHARDTRKARRVDVAKIMLEFSMHRLHEELGSEAVAAYLRKWVTEIGFSNK
jgi:hypothetical protein